VRVVIDPEKCQGHGRCFALAPELFESDDLGQGVVIGGGQVAPGQKEAAHLAEQNCPEYAISLVE